MYADRIRYLNFRNIASADLTLSPGVNILFGENAAGKTNALEGLWLFAQGRSFRSGQAADLVKFGAPHAELALTMADSARTQELRMQFTATGRKTIRANGVFLRKLSDFIGRFRAVLFGPQHLSLVQAGPAERRGFLDAAICQLEPAYLATLSRYNQILKQRNALLKDEHRGADFLTMLRLFGGQLAAESATLAASRARYLAELSPVMAAMIAEISGGRETCRIEYHSPLTADGYAEALARHEAAECRSGTTLVGAHKDDFTIYLNDKDARYFASQGQQRSLALALKLGEGELARAHTGDYPVFLFDDIMSELDDKRKQYLMTGLVGRQVIMTTCDSTAMQGFAGPHVIRVENVAGQAVFLDCDFSPTR